MYHDFTIEGEMFRLRPAVESDAVLIAALRGDHSRSRYLPALSADPETHRAWLRAHAIKPDDYYFIIEQKATARAEGTIGLFSIDHDAAKAEWGRWILRRDSCAAAESVALIYRFAFATLGLREVYCRTYADNARCIRMHDKYSQRRDLPLTDYFERNGAKIDAVEHYLTAATFPRAAQRLMPAARYLAARQGRTNFPNDAHKRQDGLQNSSFWFRCRSRLIANLVHSRFPEARRIVDLGCGTGYVMRALAEAAPAAALIGLDLDEDALHRAGQRLGPGAALARGDVTNPPLGAGTDLICAFDVLEHLDDDQAALSAWASGLCPGGGALLSVPQHPLLWSGADTFARHKRRYRRGELEAKCRRAGLDVVFTTSFVCLLSPLYLARRLRWRLSRNPDPYAELALPAWLDRLFERELDLELLLIRWGVRWPFGGSRFVVARKRVVESP